MEVVVALNPHVFAGEEVTLAEALERLREQGKILKSTRISLVRTEQVESVTWAKKQQDQDRVRRSKNWQRRSTRYPHSVHLILFSSPPTQS